MACGDVIIKRRDGVVAYESGIHSKCYRELELIQTKHEELIHGLPVVKTNQRRQTMTQQELMQSMEVAPIKLQYKVRLQKEAGEAGPTEERDVVCNYVEVDAAGVYNFYAYINGQHSIIYSVRISNVEDIEFTGMV